MSISSIWTETTHWNFKHNCNIYNPTLFCFTTVTGVSSWCDVKCACPSASSSAFPFNGLVNRFELRDKSEGCAKWYIGERRLRITPHFKHTPPLLEERMGLIRWRIKMLLQNKQGFVKAELENTNKENEPSTCLNRKANKFAQCRQMPEVRV